MIAVRLQTLRNAAVGTDARSTDPALILIAGVGASFDFDFNDYLHIASLCAVPQPRATARNAQNPDLVHFPLGNFLTSSVIIVSPVSVNRSRAHTQALALYVLLVCASDGQGLSYYSAPRIAQLLQLEPAALSEARRELIGLGLIAYQKPLYQLLSLEGELQEHKSPPARVRRPAADSEPQAIGTLSGLSLKAMVKVAPKGRS